LSPSRIALASDALLRLRIAAFAASVPLLVRLPLPRLARVLRPRRAPGSVDATQVDRIVALTDDALRGRFVRQTCLVRGITLYYFLSRAGLNVTLCFGMGPMRGEMAGHCWLDVDGQPFREKEDPLPHFTAVYRIAPDVRT
jgi:hypothetical protein